MENYYRDGREYAIKYYYGIYCIVDLEEYNQCDDSFDKAVIFKGSYRQCCDYKKAHIRGGQHNEKR